MIAEIRLITVPVVCLPIREGTLTAADVTVEDTTDALTGTVGTAPLYPCVDDTPVAPGALTETDGIDGMDGTAPLYPYVDDTPVAPGALTETDGIDGMDGTAPLYPCVASMSV